MRNAPDSRGITLAHNGPMATTLTGNRAALRTLPSFERCREIRLNGRITQAEMARDIDVTTRTLQGWEAGHHRPQPRQAYRWARVLREIAHATGQEYA